MFLDFGIMGRIDPRMRWLLRELVYALLVKKDHAAAGKIVVLMGAVGKVKPEAEAAKDLEAFAQPLTLKTLGDMSHSDIGKQLSTLAEAYDEAPRSWYHRQAVPHVERYMKLLAPKWQMMSDPSSRVLRQFHGRDQPRTQQRQQRQQRQRQQRFRRTRGLEHMEIRTGTAPVTDDLTLYYEEMGDPPRRPSY